LGVKNNIVADNCYAFMHQMHLISDFKIFAGVLPTVDKELARTPSRLQAYLRL
jgi:hypothetical protein